MGNRLKGRVAVITGGASGIGRRTAELFADEEAIVIIGDCDEALLGEMRQSVGVGRWDVTREPDLERLVAGVEMLTSVASLELGPRGVRVNAIAPGFVETPMTSPTQPKSRAAYIDSIPLGRLGQPDDIARAALFLASDEFECLNGRDDGA